MARGVLQRWSSVAKAIVAQPIDGKQGPVSGHCQAVATDMALFNSEPHELEVDDCFLPRGKEEWFMAESFVSHCILMSSFSERAPEMPEEKRNFLKSSATNRSYETGPVKVKFGCAAARFFEHCLCTFA